MTPDYYSNVALMLVSFEVEILMKFKLIKL